MSARPLSFPQLRLFDIHVSELAGLEDLAALKALDKFRILFAGDNFYARVLAWRHACFLGGLLRTGCTHTFRSGAPVKPAASLAELAVFLAEYNQLSSRKSLTAGNRSLVRSHRVSV